MIEIYNLQMGTLNKFYDTVHLKLANVNSLDLNPKKIYDEI